MKAFDQFVEIIAKLRSDDGCPWDKEQTHKSLIPYAVEEAYEVIDAIQDNNMDELKKELGDLLLQVVLHAQIASEAKHFSIENVLESINEKMVRRHPHVFGDGTLKTSKQVVDQWSEIKKKEGQKHALEGIPKHAPQLFRSLKIGEKVASMNFDWPNENDVWKKVKEEVSEVAGAKGSKHKEEELGDLFFSLVQYCRHLEIDPESCLKKANEKFKSRFEKMEDLIQKDSKTIKTLTIDEWEAYWQKAKSETIPKPR